MDSALDAAKQKVRASLSGKKSGDSSSRPPNSGKDVVQLTDDNFESLVYNSKDYWLVEFFSPGCGFCQKLAPEWAEAATQLKGKARLGAIDATAQSMIPSLYNIQGYPTIYWFEPGAKGKSDGVQYDGGRTTSDIVNWVTDKIQQNRPPPETIQLVEESNLQDQCTNNQLCIVAVLPHILDCQSVCRKGYISMLNKVAAKYKNKFWG